MRKGSVTEPWTFKELIEDDSEPPTPIIDDGVLLEQTLLIIHGQPKDGKSFLAFNMAVAIATGQDFAGFKVHGQHTVMILSAEGGYFPNRERVKVMTRNSDTDLMSNIWYTNKAFLNLDDQSDLEALEETIKRIQPDVLVIDPLIRFHSGDENSSTDMSKVFAILRKLIEDHNLSVILVHHDGKNETKSARGSSVIMSEFDSSIQFKKHGDSHTVSFHMRHVETPADRKLCFNSITLWFDSGESDPVIGILSKDGSMKKADIAKALQNVHGYSQSQSYKLITRTLSVNNRVRVKDKTLCLRG